MPDLQTCLCGKVFDFERGGFQSMPEQKVYACSSECATKHDPHGVWRYANDTFVVRVNPADLEEWSEEARKLYYSRNDDAEGQQRET